jgi:inosose dehydratase
VSGLRLANAPVSYGVFGSTVAGASPAELLDTVAAAGYQGCELGPPGFFGSPAATAQAFADRGLAAVGSYVPIHLGLDDATVTADLDRMAVTCAELAASGGGLAILADEGSAPLLVNPARAWDDRSLALTSDQWTTLAGRVQQALDLAAGFGVRCSFHPHISTYVESPWEVERLLELTPVDLTLDIGHLRLAGGDPAECAAAWSARINHVHVKDADLSVLAAARAAGRTDFDDWWAQVCTPLGHGDVDIDGFLRVLVGTGYDGWLVVEQDRGPAGPAQYPGVAAQQEANRVWLAERVYGALAALGRGER